MTSGLSGRVLTLSGHPVILCTTGARGAAAHPRRSEMAKARATDQPEPTDIEGRDDVEGHNMLIDPSMARGMSAGRSREIERQLRDEQRAREARQREQKHR
jgi:hypothetical protein